VELFTVNEAYLYVWAKSVSNDTYSPVVRMVIQGYDYVPTSIVSRDFSIDPSTSNGWSINALNINNAIFTDRPTSYPVSYVNSNFLNYWHLIPSVNPPGGVRPNNMIISFTHSTTVYVLGSSTAYTPGASWSLYTGPIILISPGNYLASSNDASYSSATTMVYYKHVSALPNHQNLDITIHSHSCSFII
jgi:hypothetical protein